MFELKLPNGEIIKSSDSLDLIKALAAFEDEFDVNDPDADYLTYEWLGDLRDCL